MDIFQRNLPFFFMRDDVSFQKIRKECGYCFMNYKMGIIFFCRCGISTCRGHLGLHNDESEGSKHFPIFWFKYEKMLKMNFRLGCDDEHFPIIEKILKENEQERLEYYFSKIECPHLKEIRRKSFLKPPVIDGIVCEECSITEDLYLCLSCGKYLCSRGVDKTAGNKHAQDHSKKSGHIFFARMKTFQLNFVGEVFCYKCDYFITAVRLRNFCNFEEDESAKQEDVMLLTKSIKDIESPNFTEDTLDCKRDIVEEVSHVGIENLGSTCYLSCVLQLLGNTMDKIDDNYEHCKFKDVTACFRCQFVKIIFGIQNPIKQYLNIFDFTQIVQTDFNFFRGFQNDILELLYKMFMRFFELEALHQLNNIEDNYKTIGSANEVCECHDSTTVTYSKLIFEIPGDANLCENIKQFLFVPTTCPKAVCENIRIKKYAKFLLITAIDGYYDNGSFIKRKSKINKEFLLSERKYTLHSIIFHKGKITAGHYMYYLNDNFNISMSDKDIIEDPNLDEIYEQAYLVCYKII